MPRPDANEPQSEEIVFEQELVEVERSLQALKQRYSQVQQDQDTQAQLQQRQETLKQQLKLRPTAEMKAELKQIEDQLDELATSLESQLFTWGSLKDSFWQIIRFSGLGLVLGWMLAFAVLQSPKPEPASHTSPMPATPAPPTP
jgi:small-conductance mechanosensitive channel